MMGTRDYVLIGVNGNDQQFMQVREAVAKTPGILNFGVHSGADIYQVKQNLRVLVRSARDSGCRTNLLPFRTER
jgi:hypothetical protein